MNTHAVVSTHANVHVPCVRVCVCVLHTCLRVCLVNSSCGPSRISERKRKKGGQDSSGLPAVCQGARHLGEGTPPNASAA